jgi:hypothetical protein
MFPGIRGVPEILEEEINREAGAEERKNAAGAGRSPSNFSREIDSDEGSSSNEGEDAR